MATNKRKEAPALFELLDKSTLRVPKNPSGSLKIPSWWSNRAPQPTASADTDDPAPLPHTAAPPPGSPRTPPMSSAPLDFARLMTPTGRWFLPIAIASVLIFSIVVIYFVTRPGRVVPKTPAAMAPPLFQPRPKFIPVHNGGNGRPPTLHNTGGGGTVARQSPTKTGKVGHVYGPNQVTRYTGRWYLAIVTTRPDLARRAAEVIAKDGVDVSLQNDRDHEQTVVSVMGFKKRDSRRARQFRQFVVQIGRDLPQARRTHHGAWDNAYYFYIHPAK